MKTRRGLKEKIKSCKADFALERISPRDDDYYVITVNRELGVYKAIRQVKRSVKVSPSCVESIDGNLVVTYIFLSGRYRIVFDIGENDVLANIMAPSYEEEIYMRERSWRSVMAAMRSVLTKHAPITPVLWNVK